MAGTIAIKDLLNPLESNNSQVQEHNYDANYPIERGNNLLDMYQECTSSRLSTLDSPFLDCNDDFLQVANHERKYSFIPQDNISIATSNDLYQRSSISDSTALPCFFQKKQFNKSLFISVNGEPQGCCSCIQETNPEFDNWNITKIGQYFLNWKIDMINYFGNPRNLLAQGFKLNLDSLDKGVYLVGTALHCNILVSDTEIGCPSCPNILCTIYSYGKSKEKVIVSKDDLNGGGRAMELAPGWSHSISSVFKMDVQDDNNFRIYDLSRPPFTKVMKGPPDFIFPYNNDIIFIGEAINNYQRFKTIYCKKELIFELEYDTATKIGEIYYSDPVARRQRIYPARKVGLIQISATKFILNFNYSYPSNFATGVEQDVNYLVIPMEGGLNPGYF